MCILTQVQAECASAGLILKHCCLYRCLDNAHWYSGLKLFFNVGKSHELIILCKKIKRKFNQLSYICSVILSIIQYKSKKQLKAWRLEAATVPDQMTFKCKNLRSHTSR